MTDNKRPESELYTRLKKGRFIPIIRIYDPKVAGFVAQALIRAGLPSVEITMSVPSADKIIASLVQAHGDSILVGAGTVLNKDQACTVIDAGASFVVSPVTDPEVIKLCNKKNIPVLPGALSPTEVLQAHRFGADAVKIFPSTSVEGTKHLKALKAVFPFIDLVPTGGVQLDNMRDFFSAGAAMVGIGTDLVSPDMIARGDMAEIEERGRAYLNEAGKIRKENGS